MRRTALHLAVVAVVCLAAAGGTAATRDVDVSATPPAPGAASTHAVTATVDEAAAGNWTALVVAYGDAGADVSDVGLGDVVIIGIDRGDDDGAAVDVRAGDDMWSVDGSDGGTTLTVGLGGSYTLSPGDQVVVVYADASNPPTAGAYPIDLSVVTGGGTTTATATLRVGSPEVTFENQTERAGADAPRVVVRSVTVPDGGFVAVTGRDGATLGHSAYLQPGTHENVTVTLSRAPDGAERLVATAHTDDGDRSFEGPLDDPAYVDGGQPVADAAVVNDGKTATATATPGGTPTVPPPTDTPTLPLSPTPPTDTPTLPLSPTPPTDTPTLPPSPTPPTGGPTTTAPPTAVPTDRPSVTVTPPSPSPVPTVTTTPGLTLLGGLVALLCAAVLARRRR
jgi:PGF-CTERM protein